ncbi:MAG: hypothetical protein ACF8R7_00015 [Phycisphaerales bacterium JB039]
MVESSYLFSPDDTLKLVAVAGGLLLGAFFIGMILLICWWDTRRKVRQTEEFESSRREIAAYVAEGSIAPDDAAKLLATGRSLRHRIVDGL